MFEVIIEKNCDNRENVCNATNMIIEEIKEKVALNNLKSLKYFVVADMDSKKYKKTVENYQKILCCNVSITSNTTYEGGGITLQGISEDKEFVQAVIVKSGIVCEMCCDLLNKSGKYKINVPNSIKDMGLVLIYHEIGHVIDNQNIYTMRGKINDKFIYNLNTHCECNEWLEENVYSLWGEYYAQCFSLRYADVTEKVYMINKKQLEDCIQSYCIESYKKEQKKKFVTERIYRIIYFFMHCLAYDHNNDNTNFNYTQFEMDARAKQYIPYMIEIETEIINMYNTYPNWKEKVYVKNFVNTIDKLFQFEMENYY